MPRSSSCATSRRPGTCSCQDSPIPNGWVICDNSSIAEPPWRSERWHRQIASLASGGSHACSSCGGGTPMTVRQARSEVTRRKIIDAAVGLFNDVGYSNAGLGDIIEHAGLTKGALYHHFSSKEA